MPWYPKCLVWMTVSASPGILLEMQNLQLHYRLPNQNLHFNKIPGWFLCIWTLPSHPPFITPLPCSYLAKAKIKLDLTNHVRGKEVKGSALQYVNEHIYLLSRFSVLPSITFVLFISSFSLLMLPGRPSPSSATDPSLNPDCNSFIPHH